MANNDVKVSALNSVSTLSTDDLSLETVVDELSETGYTSKKITEGAKASQYLEAFTFANLNTTAKTIVGAINEAATTGAGDFPIHIHNSTITETAGEVLDAMADGLKPYVIWTNNSQSNYTFTYALAGVWNPDATTETLIFGCPITGAVRTIHIFINPTTRTYSSSISIVDYNIPQINDSSTSSSAVWSSQKTASELADKAEIDDNTVSTASAWSSSRIASFLPTDTASGAVANFPDGADGVPVDSLVADIDYKDTTGFNAVNVTRAGKNQLAKSFIYNDNDDLDNLSECFFIKAGSYTFSFGEMTNATSWRFLIRLKDANGNNLNTSDYITTVSSMSWSATRKAWINNANTTAKICKFTLNQDCFIRILFGVGNTSASSVASDSQLETGADVTTYEPSTTTASTINLGGTIYGGSVDVTNGTVTSTKAQDGTDLPDPVVTTIDPTMINTLKGVNNIWADTGDVAVNYRADVGLYVDKKLASLSNNRGLSLSKSEPEEVKEEEQEGDEDVNR